MTKCQCKKVCFDTIIYFHLYGCPKTKEYKKYQKLKFYQKLFRKDPYNLYLGNFKV